MSVTIDDTVRFLSDKIGSGDPEADAAAPEVKVDRWGCVTLNTIQFIAARWDYEPGMDRRFDEFCETLDTWGTGLMEAWREERERVCKENGWHYEHLTLDNDYNYGGMLDHTLQFNAWAEEDEDGDRKTYILIQFHMGGDVRGNYTRPYMFTDCADDGWAELYDTCKFDMFVVDREPAVNPNQTTLDGEAPSEPRFYFTYDARDGFSAYSDTGMYHSENELPAPWDDILANVFDEDDWDEERQTFRLHDGNGYFQFAAQCPSG